MEDFNEFDENPDLNITPLVDIMLVLLAILMVTAPTLTFDENIKLPAGSQLASNKLSKDDLVISINSSKIITIADKKMSMKELADNLTLLKNTYDQNAPVYIRADKNLLYDNVMFVLKTLKQSGFEKVSLQTS